MWVSVLIPPTFCGRNGTQIYDEKVQVLSRLLHQPFLAVEAKWWRGIKTELNNWDKGLAIGEQQRKESLI